ncbi:MAG: hypothetical protein R3B09_04520 [Nannocystaceae bacterium]
MAGRRQVGDLRALALPLEAALIVVADDPRDLGDLDRVEGEVGLDADGLDPVIAGDLVLGDGELEGELLAVGGDRLEHLHRPLAEGAPADDDAAAERLEAAGDHLGARRRLLVDEGDDADPGVDQDLGLGRLGLAPGRRPDDHQLALGHQDVDDLHRLGEEAAGVAAEVEDEPLQRARGLHRGDRLAGLLGGVLLEDGHPQVGDVAGEAGGDHRLDPDDLADDLEGLDLAAALDLEDHLGVDRPAEEVHRVDLGEVDGRLLVDLQDQVAGQEPGLLRRRAGDDPGDPDPPLLDHDLGADPPELALGADAEVVALLGVQEDGVGIEGGEEAVDRRVLEAVERLVVGEGEVGLGEDQDLLEDLGGGEDGGDLADDDLLALAADRDLDLVGADHLGEELGRVDAEVVEGPAELLAGVEAGLVEVLLLDRVGRPDQEGEGPGLEVEERLDVDLGPGRRAGGGLGIAGGVRAVPRTRRRKRSEEREGGEGADHGPARIPRERGPSDLYD